MRKQTLRVKLTILLAFILIASITLPGGKLEAASSFMGEVEEKYEALEDKFTKQYEADLKSETNYYEQPRVSGRSAEGGLQEA